MLTHDACVVLVVATLTWWSSASVAPHSRAARAQPKVTACVQFVGGQPAGQGYWAAIGDLKDATEIILGTQGTVITKDIDMDVMWRSKVDSEKKSNLSTKFN